MHQVRPPDNLLKTVPLADYLWFGCPFCLHLPTQVPYEQENIEHFQCSNCGSYGGTCQDITKPQGRFDWSGGPLTIDLIPHPSHETAPPTVFSEVRLSVISMVFDHLKQILIPRFYGDTASTIGNQLQIQLDELPGESQPFTVHAIGSSQLLPIITIVNHNNKPGAESVTIDFRIVAKQPYFLPRDRGTGQFTDLDAQTQCLKLLKSS